MRSCLRLLVVSVVALIALSISSAAAAPLPQSQGLQSSDLSRLRSAGAVELSPDGRRIAYSVTMFDQPGRPYSQIWIMDLATQKSARLGSEKERTGGPKWSSDGKWLAYFGGEGEKAGLTLAQADGSGATFLTQVSGSNSPLPGQGSSVAWSPDSKQIAFISGS